jgi:hypothetical protein
MLTLGLGFAIVVAATGVVVAAVLLRATMPVERLFVWGSVIPPLLLLFPIGMMMAGRGSYGLAVPMLLSVLFGGVSVLLGLVLVSLRLREHRPWKMLAAATAWSGLPLVAMVAIGVWGK